MQLENVRLIEKLPLREDVEGVADEYLVTGDSFMRLARKVNEIIDTINEIIMEVE